MLRLLGRRDYTSTELVQRLIDRGHAPDEVQAALQALVADGTIDDRRVAMAHVRTAARVKGRGAFRIARELEARGVAADVIRDALTQISRDDDREAIERILARRRISRPLPPDQRRKVFQQLLRRGFSAATIRTVLDADDREDA